MAEPLFWRIRVLKVFFAAIFVIFGIRLFDLQILRFDEFTAQAKAQHEKRSVLQARRGKILVRKNSFTEELTPLATNNTLQMLFIDPLILAYPKFNPKLEASTQEPGNPKLAAQILAPILIHAHCEKIDGCVIETDPSKWTPTEARAIAAYEQELEKVFTETEARNVILQTDLAADRLLDVQALRLNGISIEGSKVVADPVTILSVKDAAMQLSPILGLSEETLTGMLARRHKRYVEITQKIVPEVSEKIQELKNNPQYRDILRGVQLKDEYWRYYPERSLASQILGFVDSAGNGQYGIEGRFDRELRGKEGYILGATNTRGQRIFGDSLGIERAEDGSDIVLSIDRVIQGFVEKTLKEDTQMFDADFGQVIIIEPRTGKILAMANAPTFDPNDFGEVYTRYEITPEAEEIDRQNEGFNQKIPTVNENGRLYRFFNKWGPQVFRNKVITDEYEPGSVMKPLTMAGAINADEVTPQTTFNNYGPVEVDEFKIRNASEEYGGPTTMIEVINQSLNTGIVFVTRKMGAQMLYEYFRNFGFGQFTDIEFDGESPGKMDFWKNWSESELVTHGFGQGITSTPLQVAMAFGALANGGYLMKPLLVEEIIKADGTVEKFPSEQIRRVISDETYNTLKAMLLSSADNGMARGGRVKGYTIMGKTGTSQTYQNGKALSGIGTTIATYAGFGPIKDPAFVVLVKYDYPKASQWGSETASITFRKIAGFLFSYFEIPPDR